MSRIIDLLKGLFRADEVPTILIDAAAPDAAYSDSNASFAVQKKQANALLLSGLMAIKADQSIAAVENFQKAFIEFRAIGDSKSAGLVQKVIGLVLQREKDIEKVRAAYKQATFLLKLSGLNDEYVRMLLIGARMEARQYLYQEAFLLCRTAISHSRRVRYVRGEVDANCTYAELELTRGRAAEAIKLVEAAMRAGEDNADPEIVTVLERSRAMVGI